MSEVIIPEKAINLRQFADAFVITCVPKCLHFVKIVDDEMYMMPKADAKIQFMGAWALDTNYLLCVAEEEPTIYVFHECGMCERTIHIFS